MTCYFKDFYLWLCSLAKGAFDSRCGPAKNFIEWRPICNRSCNSSVIGRKSAAMLCVVYLSEGTAGNIHLHFIGRN